MSKILFVTGFCLLAPMLTAGAQCDAANKFVENNLSQIKELTKDPSQAQAKSAYGVIKIIAPYIKSIEELNQQDYYPAGRLKEIEDLCENGMNILKKALKS